MKKLLLHIPFITLISSFLGFLHPFFDSVSVFREYIIITVFICAIILLFKKKYTLVTLYSLFSLFALLSISNFSIAQLTKSAGSGRHYSLYQKNLLFINNNFDDIIKDIEQLNPNFITLQEVTQKAKIGLLKKLRDKYPYQHYCDFATVGGVATVSKVPFINGSEQCLNGVALVQIEDKMYNPWLASIHLHWPWPYKQKQQVEEILPILSNLEGYKIIAGDFNMVKWSSIIATFNKALKTKTAKKGTNKTFNLIPPLISFQIDHVLMPINSIEESSIRSLYGSDHKGVYVEFWIDN